MFHGSNQGDSVAAPEEPAVAAQLKSNGPQ